MTTPSRTVLLVEDDARLRQMLKLTLPSHGYRVIDAATGEDALRLAVEKAPDVVLLDLMLPGIDGLEVARRLRAWSRVPIIVLSARGLERQKVEALDAGADDYLTKPFGFDELLARMRAALRRAERPAAGSEEPVFRCDGLVIDRAAHQVTVDGEEVHLSPTEYRLLLVLANAAGKVVTHAQLLAAVWGRGGESEARNLRVYMTYLRRKLEAEPARPRFLVTEAGVGYRLRCADQDEERGGA